MKPSPPLPHLLPGRQVGWDDDVLLELNEPRHGALLPLNSREVRLALEAVSVRHAVHNQWHASPLRLVHLHL